MGLLKKIGFILLVIGILLLLLGLYSFIATWGTQTISSIIKLLILSVIVIIIGLVLIFFNKLKKSK